MGLQDFTTAVQTQAATDSRLPVGTTFAFGPVQLPRHSSPPRIVWVPADGGYEGPEKSGFDPQQIFTRRQNVECHCWGADFATAETMADVVLVAAYEVARGVVNPTKFDQGRPDNLQEGWLFIVTFEVLLPVTLDTDATATILTEDINAEFNEE